MDDLLNKLARIVLMALLVCAAGCRSSAPYVWVQRLPPGQRRRADRSSAWAT